MQVCNEETSETVKKTEKYTDFVLFISFINAACQDVRSIGEKEPLTCNHVEFHGLRAWRGHGTADG